MLLSDAAARWDNETLVAAVNDFLGDPSNVISQESIEVEELSREKDTGKVRFYIDVENPNDSRYKREVARKLPRFRYCHAKVKVMDGSSGYADLKFRTWLEFTPSSRPVVPAWQLFLFLLCICLCVWASYSLWDHWHNYDKPWKNLVPRFLEEGMVGLVYGGGGLMGVAA